MIEVVLRGAKGDWVSCKKADEVKERKSVAALLLWWCSTSSCLYWPCQGWVEDGLGFPPALRLLLE